MISKKQLFDMADECSEKAEKAYRNYQDTGISRYDRERRKNEDLSDAFRMAANAAEDHQALVHLRCNIANIASMTDDVCLAKSLRAMARLLGLIRGDTE